MRSARKPAASSYGPGLGACSTFVYIELASLVGGVEIARFSEDG